MVFASGLTILALLFFPVVSELTCAFPVVCSECPTKNRCTVKSTERGHLGNGSLLIAKQYTTCLLEPDSFYIVVNGFPSKHSEYPVEVERGEVGHLRKILQGVFLIQVGINIIHYPVDAQVILLSGLVLYA